MNLGRRGGLGQGVEPRKRIPKPVFSRRRKSHHRRILTEGEEEKEDEGRRSVGMSTGFRRSRTLGVVNRRTHGSDRLQWTSMDRT